MAKKTTLRKKQLTFGAVESADRVVVLRGKRRDSINSGLSEKAVNKIDRYEAASQQAEQPLSTIRLG